MNAEEVAETFAKASRLIKAATGEAYGDGYTVTDVFDGWAGKAEDDYAVIVSGNWNHTGPSGHYEEVNGSREWVRPTLTKAQSLPVRLGEALERIGCELVWLDETFRCEDCNRAVSTSSYFLPSDEVVTPSGLVLCRWCAVKPHNLTDVMESLAEDGCIASFFDSSSLASAEEQGFNRQDFDRYTVTEDVARALKETKERKDVAYAVECHTSSGYTILSMRQEVERYADVSVIWNGALDEETTVYEDEEVDAIIAEAQAEAERDGSSLVQVFVLWHEHDNDGQECECVQYLTDHRPSYEFAPTEEEV